MTSKFSVVTTLFTILNCNALKWTGLHCTALHGTALYCTTLHYTALHCTELHCTALHYTALHSAELHFSELRMLAWHRIFVYIALHCTVHNQPGTQHSIEFTCDCICQKMIQNIKEGVIWAAAVIQAAAILHYGRDGYFTICNKTNFKIKYENLTWIWVEDGKNTRLLWHFLNGFFPGGKLLACEMQYLGSESPLWENCSIWGELKKTTTSKT